MPLYESAYLEAIRTHLPLIFQNHPAVHIILISPNGGGKFPVTERWLDFFPTLKEVEDHLDKGLRIAIKPSSVDRVVVDVDHGGQRGWPLLQDTFSLSKIKKEPAKYCAHSSTHGKYHLWLPVKDVDHFVLNRKKFIKEVGTENEYSGDILVNGYVILHKPKSIFMSRLSSGISERFFDVELKKFMMVDKTKPSHKKNIPNLTAKPATGLLKWHDGKRHDTCLQALKLITNPKHFKKDDEVKDLLSQGEIDLIVGGKLTGEQICEHALSLGSEVEEVNNLLKTHYEEMDKHVSYGDNNDDDDLRQKLINMDIVKRFEYMLQDSNVSLKYDVSRQFYEIDFGDGNGVKPYFDDKNDKNCKLLRCKLRQKYPAFAKSDHNGFSLAEVVWSDVHAGFENLKHNQMDARQDYLKVDEWSSQILDDFSNGVWTSDMDECVELAKKYLSDNLEIDGDNSYDNKMYIRAISEYFFKTYALCMMNELHRSKLLIILIGHKDKGKSSFVKTLIPKDWQSPERRFFTEVSTGGTISDWRKEMAIKTIGCVGVELPEVKLGPKSPIKELIGSPIISLRNMQEKKSTDRPRNFWCMGTANRGQTDLSARDPDFTGKCGFLHITKISKHCQEYADANLKKAIIGGWILHSQTVKENGGKITDLDHPFVGVEETEPAHKRWRDAIDREAGTSDEDVLSERLKEMMLSACFYKKDENGKMVKNDDIFMPAKISKTTPDLSTKMKYEHLFDAYKIFVELKSRRDWTGSGVVSHEIDELKAINNSKLFKTALGMSDWDGNNRNRALGRYWKLVDKTGYWAMMGYPGISDETQP